MGQPKGWFLPRTSWQGPIPEFDRFYTVAWLKCPVKTCVST